MLQDELEKLEHLGDEIADAGRELVAQCQGAIFPCDALAITVLSRSLSLVSGFTLLVKSGNYQCAAGLLRFQLDNVLRLFGVTTCKDPHGIASDVLNGKRLSKIKHDTGQLMRDAYLVELLSTMNPWVTETYSVLSGFIHLSDQHFQHMLMQSVQTPDGTREFRVSDTDEYIPIEHKVNLVRAFSAVTIGATKLVHQWASNRGNFGPPEELKARFKQVV